MKALKWTEKDGRSFATAHGFRYEVIGGDCIFYGTEVGHFWTDSNASATEAKKACEKHHAEICRLLAKGSK